MNTTMVGKVPGCVKSHHIGLVCHDRAGRGERAGIAGDGVGSVTGISPDNLCAFADGDGRWLERIPPILLDDLHMDDG